MIETIGASIEQNIGQFLVAMSLPRLPGRKTGQWQIHSKGGDILGLVSWYGRWRQYTFNPEEGTTYSAGCLRDLVAFLERVNKERGSA